MFSSEIGLHRFIGKKKIGHKCEGGGEAAPSVALSLHYYTQSFITTCKKKMCQKLFLHVIIKAKHVSSVT